MRKCAQCVAVQSDQEMQTRRFPQMNTVAFGRVLVNSSPLVAILNIILSPLSDSQGRVSVKGIPLEYFLALIFRDPLLSEGRLHQEIQFIMGWPLTSVSVPLHVFFDTSQETFTASAY